MKLSEFVKTEYGKSISECTNEELYYALLTLTKKMASGKQHGNSKKIICRQQCQIHGLQRKAGLQKQM